MRIEAWTCRDGEVMDFSLTETQELIRASAAEWLSERSGPEFVRAMAEDDQGYTAEYWRELAELGWLGLLIPEQYGGSGMRFADMAVLLHEWGAALAPGPLVESSIVAVDMITGFGSDEAKSRLLPGIASGESVVIPPSDITNSDDATITASETGDGWVLDGNARFAPYANSADILILVAATKFGQLLFALDPSSVSGTLSLSQVKMASGVPTFNLELNEVLCPDTALLSDELVWMDIERYSRFTGATARAIQMVGAGNLVLDRTLEYVKTRRQFGRPIGAFQAIQHYMADIALKVKSAQHMVNRAAWAKGNVDNRDTQIRYVTQAKWAANTLIPQVCWTAHQVHGAIGFTWEHDLHLYTRRVLSWRAEYGDTDNSRDVMAQYVDD